LGTVSVGTSTSCRPRVRLARERPESDDEWDQGRRRTGDDAPHEALPVDLRRAPARAASTGDCRWALVLHRRTTFDSARASVCTLAMGH
jgi:hypothetical protein